MDWKFPRSMALRAVCACALIACVHAPAAVSAATKAKEKPAPAAPAKPAATQDTTLCDSLTATLMGRIASMKALEVSIEKEREKPAATLSGLFTELAGGHYDGVAMKKKMRRLEREREMATELNRLLASSSCSQVDIDAELAKAQAGTTTDDDAAGTNDPLAHDPLRGKLGQ